MGEYAEYEIDRLINRVPRFNPRRSKEKQDAQRAKKQAAERESARRLFKGVGVPENKGSEEK